MSEQPSSSSDGSRIPKRLTINLGKLDQEIRERLEEMARERGIPVSDLVNKILVQEAERMMRIGPEKIALGEHLFGNPCWEIREKTPEPPSLGGWIRKSD